MYCSGTAALEQKRGHNVRSMMCVRNHLSANDEVKFGSHCLEAVNIWSTLLSNAPLTFCHEAQYSLLSMISQVYNSV